eukprot:364639-Chlamydomonas_euryale.AAC.19
MKVWRMSKDPPALVCVASVGMAVCTNSTLPVDMTICPAAYPTLLHCVELSWSHHGRSKQTRSHPKKAGAIEKCICVAT